MYKTFKYPAKVTCVGTFKGSFWKATFRDLPGATFRDLPRAAEGDTPEEALKEATVLLADTLRAFIKEGKEIPSPSDMLEGEVMIKVTMLFVGIPSTSTTTATMSYALDADIESIAALDTFPVPDDEETVKASLSSYDAEADHDQDPDQDGPSPHAASLTKYAQDASRTRKPWLLWEACRSGDEGWFPCTSTTMWMDGYEYRRIAERPRFINGIEVPCPVREALGEGDWYWLIHLNYNSTVENLRWSGDKYDQRNLERGLIYRTEAEAKVVAEALLSLLK